jgi:hypothetical protein
MEQYDLAKLIELKTREPSFESRWLKKLETLDVAKINEFRNKCKEPKRVGQLVELGLIKAGELGSIRLIDYFVLQLKVNINCLATFNVYLKYLSIFRHTFKSI